MIRFCFKSLRVQFLAACWDAFIPAPASAIALSNPRAVACYGRTVEGGKTILDLARIRYLDRPFRVSGMTTWYPALFQRRAS